MKFPPDGEPELSEIPVGEARFSGSPEFFTRVFWGHDPALPHLLLEKLGERLGAQIPEGFEQIFRPGTL